MLKRAVSIKVPSTTANTIWSDTQKLIEDKRVLPILSNCMLATLFGSNVTNIAAFWADDVSSPLDEDANRDLARVAQFHSVNINNPRQAKLDYHLAIKSYLLGEAQDDPTVDNDYIANLIDEKQRPTLDKTSLSTIARNLGYPKFADLNRNPLRLLAELPLPIYVTTSHHKFLEAELAKTNTKVPVTEIFYWNDTLQTIPSIYDKEPGYQPTIERPLVYHLFGIDDYPESLVLSEDDYLDILIKLSTLKREVKVGESARIASASAKFDIPAELKIALSGAGLLLLGYQVYDWEFRILFKWLVEYIGESRKGKGAPESICMQVKPGEDAHRVQEYLDKFFGQKSFHVYWDDLEPCVHELWKRWKGEA